MDQYAGTQVRELIINVNAMRTSYASKVWDPIWRGYDPNGPDDQPLLASLKPEDSQRRARLDPHGVAAGRGRHRRLCALDRPRTQAGRLAVAFDAHERSAQCRRRARLHPQRILAREPATAPRPVPRRSVDRQAPRLRQARGARAPHAADSRARRTLRLRRSRVGLDAFRIPLPARPRGRGLRRDHRVHARGARASRRSGRRSAGTRFCWARAFPRVRTRRWVWEWTACGGRGKA